MLHASVIMFSPRVSGVGSHVSLKNLRQTSTRGDVSSDLLGIWSYFPSRCFPPFFLVLARCSPTSRYTLFRILARPVEKCQKVFLFCGMVQNSEQNFSYIFFSFKLFKKKKNKLDFFPLPSSFFLPLFI